MIKNYIKIAWRNLLRSRLTSFISTAGLAIGICCFLLLATYILNELSYDRFNTNANRIVRLVEHLKASAGSDEVIIAVTPTAPVPVFKQELSAIADGVRVYNYTSGKAAAVEYGDKLFNEPKMLVADDSFFKIFSFKFLEGNPSTALSQVSSVVITSAIAKKYFGDEDPMGKILKVNGIRSLMVSGVIAGVPENSQIKFDIMGNYAMLSRSKSRQWDSANDYSYLLLKPGISLQSAGQAINAYVSTRFKNDPDNRSFYSLEPLTQVHLFSKAQDNLEPVANVKSVYILALVAVILLLLACVNFLNLVTAKSIERAQEIGVRKVMGAMRGQLFTQFIFEAALITFVSLMVGVLLAACCFPSFSNLTGHQLSFQSWDLGLLAPLLIGLFVVVTLIAGTYPSLYLSAFKPAVTLKSKAGATAAGGNFLRKSLVVFQFAVSVFFIISTIIAGSQLSYIRKMDTGINRSEVMVLNIGGMPFNKLEALRSDLMQQPGVKNVSASYDSPVDVRGGYPINKIDGRKIQLMVTAIPVERNFTNTLGIKLIAGEDFTVSDEQQVQDTSWEKRRYAFILNERAVAALGFKPGEAIGKIMKMSGREGIIRGVAQNFNFASLHQEISPIVLFTEYDYFGKLLIKTSGADMVGTMDNVKRGWKSFYPDVPFEAHFLDQEYNELYKSEQQTSNVLTVFTFITIFISCLGLFGLAIFSTRQRIREVGIRKVLGASVVNIVGLISWDFLKLVVISIVIASPIAYIIMTRWLQDFVYRIQIQWWVFAVAAAAAMLIAFVTIGYQSIKTAIANPVKSLRAE